MRTKLFTILLTAIFLLGTSTANAQLGSLKNAALKGVSKAIEKKIEKKTEEKTTEVLDKILPPDTVSSTSSAYSSGSNSSSDALNSTLANRYMNRMGVGINNVKYEQHYSYTTQMSLYIESTTQNEEAAPTVSKGYINTYFDESKRNYAIDIRDTGTPDKSTLIIYDTQDSVLLLLSNENGEKTGMAIPVTIDSISTDVELAEEDALSDAELSTLFPYYQLTGRTKDILGYPCREYTWLTYDSTRVESWITRAVKFDYSQAYSYMGIFLFSNGAPSLLGTTMEMHLTDLRTANRSDMYVKEINARTSKEFNLSGYQVMGFSGMK